MIRVSVHIPKDDLCCHLWMACSKSGLCAGACSYDLMGVDYKGHPDLRRIFLADDFCRSSTAQGLREPREKVREGKNDEYL